MCPEENHEDVQRAGTPLLWRQAERGGGVQPGEILEHLPISKGPPGKLERDF